MRERVPGDTGKCGPSCPPHHWKIGNNGIGRCIKDGCTLVRDFKALQAKIQGSPIKVYFRPQEQLPFGYVEEIKIGGGHGRDRRASG